MELRLPDIGLKFWGPPLWLEVTMTGPDSDSWPASPGQAESWNWQSTDTCVEAERLVAQGADDDQVVIAVGRYTIENLILNAVHEIGEWLRFDGRRLFPAHPPAGQSPAADDSQGNGTVQLAVTFGSSGPPVPPTAVRAQHPLDELTARRQLRRLNELAGPPSRFTYLPGTAVHYDPLGPTVGLHQGSHSAAGWRSVWSAATVDAVKDDADAQTLISCVERDVHGALVAWEADRVCRAFYLDRRRPWRLCAPGAPLPTEPAADDAGTDEIVTLAISYLDPA